MPCNKKNLTRNQMKKEKNPRFGWGGEGCFGDLLLLFGYSASEIEFGKNFEKIVQRKFYFGKKNVLKYGLICRYYDMYGISKLFAPLFIVIVICK